MSDFYIFNSCSTKFFWVKNKKRRWCQSEKTKNKPTFSWIDYNYFPIKYVYNPVFHTSFRDMEDVLKEHLNFTEIFYQIFFKKNFGGRTDET